MAKTADGNVDILAMDEIVSLAIYSMIENPEPYEEVIGFSTKLGFGMNCSEKSEYWLTRYNKRHLILLRLHIS